MKRKTYVLALLLVALCMLEGCSLLAPAPGHPAPGVEYLSCEAQSGEDLFVCVTVDCNTGYSSLAFGKCAPGTPACTDGIQGCVNATW